MSNRFRISTYRVRPGDETDVEPRHGWYATAELASGAELGPLGPFESKHVAEEAATDIALEMVEEWQ